MQFLLLLAKDFKTSLFLIYDCQGLFRILGPRRPCMVLVSFVTTVQAFPTIASLATTVTNRQLGELGRFLGHIIFFLGSLDRVVYCRHTDISLQNMK